MGRKGSFLSAAIKMLVLSCKKGKAEPPAASVLISCPALASDNDEHRQRGMQRLLATTTATAMANCRTRQRRLMLLLLLFQRSSALASCWHRRRSNGKTNKHSVAKLCACCC